MHQLRVYFGPCQVHPPRLLEPSVFRPQWQAWWSLSKLLGYWKHSAAAVALRRSQTRRIVTLREFPYLTCVVLSSCKQPTSSDMTLRIYVERNRRYWTTQDH
jgi:hypothetical protein